MTAPAEHPAAHPDGEETPAQLAARLKERVYVTFTALAVLIALTSHGDPPGPLSSALSLVLTTVGVLLAGFAADLIAHSTIHSALPTRETLRHMVKVGSSAFGAIVLPLILLVLAGVGLVTTSAALIGGQVVLVVALGAFAVIALRRMSMPPWKKVALAAMLVTIAAVVVVVELLAHTL